MGRQEGENCANRVAVLVLLEVRMQLDRYGEDLLEQVVLQSLFCWKFVCNIKDHLDTHRGEVLLQSLFCWKSVCNLVGEFCKDTTQWMLQSLFCWKSVCNMVLKR